MSLQAQHVDAQRHESTAGPHPEGGRFCACPAGAHLGGCLSVRDTNLECSENRIFSLFELSWYLSQPENFFVGFKVFKCVCFPAWISRHSTANKLYPLLVLATSPLFSALAHSSLRWAPRSLRHSVGPSWGLLSSVSSHLPPLQSAQTSCSPKVQPSYLALQFPALQPSARLRSHRTQPLAGYQLSFRCCEPRPGGPCPGVEQGRCPTDK